MPAHQLARRKRLPGCRYGLKDLLVFTAVAAVYLAAYVAIFRRATGQDALLYSAIAIGVCGGSLLGILAPRSRAQRRAGRVLVRLRGNPARAPWLVSIGSIPLTVAVFAKAVDLSPETRPILCMLLVAVVTLSAWFSLVSALERWMELCEHGILVNRATFSPWHQVGSAGWSLDDGGRLVVGHGLWKMEGQIPPYKRQRVKELLTEKTAEPR